jgi:hypothetical protein
MDTDTLSGAQFSGGMDSSMSNTDSSGMGGPLGSSGTPSPMGAGSGGMPSAPSGF